MRGDFSESSPPQVDRDYQVGWGDVATVGRYAADFQPLPARHEQSIRLACAVNRQHDLYRRRLSLNYAERGNPDLTDAQSLAAGQVLL